MSQRQRKAPLSSRFRKQVVSLIVLPLRNRRDALFYWKSQAQKILKITTFSTSEEQRVWNGCVDNETLEYNWITPLLDSLLAS